MKKNNILTITACGIAVVFALIGCEKTIPFNNKQTKPLMVVNSLIGADSALVVQVSKSEFFLSKQSGFTGITDAAVTLYINDLPETLTHREDGFYVSDRTPKPNDNVRIEAKHHTLGTATATSVIPPKPEIISIDTVSHIVKSPSTAYKDGKYIAIGNYLNRELTFQIKIKDRSAGKNFYRLVIREIRCYAYTSDENDLRCNNEYFLSNFDDPVFKQENGAGNFGDFFDPGNNNRYGIFNNDMFAGSAYTIRVKDNFQVGFEKNPDLGAEFEPSTGGEPKKITYRITVQSLNQEYFYYLKSRNNNKSSDMEDGLFFSEPAQIYSNITGGIGIFGGYTSAVQIIEVKP